ncbi:hypothetical protein [Nocardia sp. NPDC049526]|uniref:hypothetical protein n=1 Tax=Nocardia sp. NPDC049526 TaxID=3364316 RepID=UPI0037956FA9
MASTTASQPAAITAPAANISGWRLARRGLGAHSHVGGVRCATALEWALAPDVDAATSNPARRMTIARRFAQHMAALDPRTEIPPPGLISFDQRWHPPFIFTRTDLELLIGQAQRQVRGRLPAATHSTMLGCWEPPACGSVKRSASTVVTSTEPTRPC